MVAGAVLSAQCGAEGLMRLPRALPFATLQRKHSTDRRPVAKSASESRCPAAILAHDSGLWSTPRGFAAVFGA
jgi:hypothetical protein